MSNGTRKSCLMKMTRVKNFVDTVLFMILLALTPCVNETLTFDCAVSMVSLRLTLSCEYLRHLKPVVEILMRLFFYQL